MFQTLLILFIEKKTKYLEKRKKWCLPSMNKMSQRIKKSK